MRAVRQLDHRRSRLQSDERVSPQRAIQRLRTRLRSVACCLAYTKLTRCVHAASHAPTWQTRFACPKLHTRNPACQPGEPSGWTTPLRDMRCARHGSAPAIGRKLPRDLLRHGHLISSERALHSPVLFHQARDNGVGGLLHGRGHTSFTPPLGVVTMRFCLGLST